MNKKGKKIDKYIPYFFFIFFGIIFIADFSFVYIANKTWRGVYTEGGYKKGKNYNDTINAVNEQNKLGWKSETKYKKVGKNLAILTACLQDKNKNYIKNAKIQAKIVRPVQEGYDFKVDFVPKNNCYESKVSFPLQGQWDIELRAFKDGKVFQKVKRYIVR